MRLVFKWTILCFFSLSELWYEISSVLYSQLAFPARFAALSIMYLFLFVDSKICLPTNAVYLLIWSISLPVHSVYFSHKESRLSGRNLKKLQLFDVGIQSERVQPYPVQIGSDQLGSDTVKFSILYIVDMISLI